MGKASCDKVGLKKGRWTAEEDQALTSYVQRFGHENWRTLPKQAGLLRCGKSCRFRWRNYLRPDIKRGDYSKQEEEVIIRLHKQLGGRWSAIARSLPGRTDNEIKNYWHTHLKKRSEKNEATAETKQPTVKNSTSRANKERQFQSAPSQMILEYPVHDLMYPESFSINFAPGNGFTAINSGEPTYDVVTDDQFIMKLKSDPCEVGKSISSQSLLEELFSPEECSPSTFEDPFLQFPHSPLSFGEYDYLGVHYNTEMDVLINYYDG